MFRGRVVVGGEISFSSLWGVPILSIGKILLIESILLMKLRPRNEITSKFVYIFISKRR